MTTRRPGIPAWTMVAAITVAGAALRLWLAARNAGITMDSPLYVGMAESLAGGERMSGPAHHGYPALVALAGLLLPGRELPGRAVSIIAGIALIPLVYRLARQGATPRWAAWIAAALAALHPLLAVYSGPIMTETTFLALMLGGILLLERGRAPLAGLVLGIAYAVRPEAMVVAFVAAVALLPGPKGMRAALRFAGAFAIVAGCYVGVLSWERGTFTLTPKTALVHPPTDTRAEAEWRVGDADRPAVEPERSLPERIRWAAPGTAARYLPRLGLHLSRLVESWPWPLLALSVVGFAVRPGPLAAPLAQILLLPLLGVGANLRFTLLFLPSLAVFAGVGGAWLVARADRARGVAIALVLAAALLGAGWPWFGRPGSHALHFDDGPMAQMREAGAWLRRYGRPGATVMDRKAYVPFFAGMRHLQLPDDDYETIVRYAQASGADYLVLEEFVVETMRRQLLPLIADARFREGEHRLRAVHHVRAGPHSGVVVMEVVR
ncbi:MAG TPA: glycosyltransferase family 39 protein [Candidatus Eisenbacteria bacterium]|nr:glycosyltransferase family 39 protein [Candidatus Eisenbacteria bacterium]